MQCLILERPGSLVLEQRPIPQPGPGELLLRVKAATTCGTDLKAYRRGHPAIPMPGPLGHEYSGVVEAAGPGARFAPGDEVMGVHSAPCQACRWCRAGQENLCETVISAMVLGSYAEYLLIPARIANLNVFPKPKSLSFELASLLEPLACVAQGVLELKKVGALPCESALVIGPGAIGLMFVKALQLAGVEKVVLAGRNENRLKVGEALGAETVKWDREGKADHDVVVECTGQPEVWEASVNFARRGGRVMLFGGCPSGTAVSFSTARLHYDQITLLSPFHFGTEAVRLAKQWLEESPEELAPLITGQRRLNEAAETFRDLEAGKGIKFVFQP